MKVLFVIDTLQGSGAERSLVEIAQHFKKYTPVFVHVYEGNMMVPVLNELGIKVYSLNIPMERNFALATTELEKIYKIEKPDIIHSTLFKSDIITRRLKSKYNIPLISSYVNNNYNPLRFKDLSVVQGIKLRLVQLFDAYTSRKVDFFISNSLTIKNAKANSTFVDKDKVKVIFRGRDVEKFKNAYNEEKLKELKASLGIAQNQQVLLNVSRLIERKGQMDLLNAMPGILEKFPNTILLIAGHGIFEKKLKRKINELKIDRSVKLLGRRQDVPLLLMLADVFVFPTYFEGLPGSLIEAMLAEKVIVCSDIPENQECVDNSTAIFFNRGDVKELTDKVIYALNNKESLGLKGNYAREIALQKFDIKSVAAEYEKTYNMVLNKC